MKPLEAFEKILMLLRRLRFYEIMLFIFVAILLGGWSIKEITETALFCGNTCHVMRPYYKEWEDSKHKSVSCVRCHIPPGDGQQFVPSFRALGQVAGYLTRSYKDGKRAEVSDASCLNSDCHALRLLDGRVTYSRDIEFDHTPHLQQLRRGKILRCTSCHSQVAMGEHITVISDTCFICHFKDHPDKQDTADCQLCHKIIKSDFDHEKFIAGGVDCTNCHEGVVRGNGKLRKKSCRKCHNDPGDLVLDQPGEILHRKHVTDHKVECNECHEPILHSIPTPKESPEPDCRSCHESRHAGISLLYMGRGASGVPGSPSPMYKKHVTCRACHIAPDKTDGELASLTGRTYFALDAACDKCHEPGMGSLIKRWRMNIQKELLLTEKLLEKSERLIKAGLNKGAVDPEARRLLEKVRHNVLFIRSSAPIHNPEYAIRVLESSRQDLESAVFTKRQR